MAHRNAVPPTAANEVIANSRVTTYDSGYEYSLEHWTELHGLVQEAEAAAVPRLADHGILTAA